MRFVDTLSNTHRSAIVRVDSSRLSPRAFDTEQLEKYRQQKDFIYDDVLPQSESLWDRLKKWIWDLVNQLFQNESSSQILKYLVLAALVALLAYFILKAAGLDLKMFSKKSKTIAIPYHETEENIHEINFPEEIEKASASGNYRLAVRLFYLLSLKRLSDAQLIHWLPEKTNLQYQSELKNELQRQQFSQLTRQFEYVWYGEFMIDKEIFQEYKLSFEQFNAKLS